MIIIKLQSYSDIITNSSSELFSIFGTKFENQDILNIISCCVSGILDPIIFDEQEYRDWLKKNNFSWDNITNKDRYFHSIKTYFEDPEDIKKRLKLYIKYLHFSKNHTDIQKEYLDYFNSEILTSKEYIEKSLRSFKDNPKFTEPRTWENFSNYNTIIWNLEDNEKIINWINNNISRLPNPYSLISENTKTVRDIDKSILVMSEEDNSIYWDDIEKLEKIFGEKNIYHEHLG